MTNVNDRQVGGTHYQTAFQVWDFIIQNGTPFLEGCIIKYVTRAKKKNRSPVQDLEKALHYVDKLIDAHEKGHVQPPPTVPPDGSWPVTDFVKANELDARQFDLILFLTYWADRGDLDRIRRTLSAWLNDEINHPCRDCEGDGWVGTVFEPVNCPACSGSGKRAL